MIGLVLWALIWPANANSALGSLNWRLLEDFNQFYIVIVGLFFFLMVVAILLQTGSRVMGRPGEGTEFSNFSWFSMMFGAGLGVGLMVFATAEPLSLWGSNLVVFRVLLPQIVKRHCNLPIAGPLHTIGFTRGPSMS